MSKSYEIKYLTTVTKSDMVFRIFQCLDCNGVIAEYKNDGIKYCSICGKKFEGEIIE